MDTKKKELLWQLLPRRSSLHERPCNRFRSRLPKCCQRMLYPHGLFDLKRTAGHSTSSALSHDTSRFAGDSLAYWWSTMAARSIRRRHPRCQGRRRQQFGPPLCVQACSGAAGGPSGHRDSGRTTIRRTPPSISNRAPILLPRDTVLVKAWCWIRWKPLSSTWSRNHHDRTTHNSAFAHGRLPNRREGPTTVQKDHADRLR